MKRPQIGIIVAVVLVALSSLAVTAAGDEGSPQGQVPADASGVRDLLETPQQQESVPDGERLANQQALTDLATDLDIETIRDNGFAGMVNNAALNTSVIWWEGDIPAEEAELIAKARARLNIETRTAAHSAYELTTIADRNADLLAKYSVSPRQDGGGFIVTVSDESQVVAAEHLSERLGVPVFVAIGAPFQFAGGGRQQDAAPHYGGSGMIQHANPTSSYCSLGYAVLDGATGLFLSAAHCGDVRWDTADGNLLAYASDVQTYNPQDSMLLDPAGGTQGRAYMSGYQSTFSRKVARGTPTAVGDEVFTSGANSGAHRDLVVTDVNVRPTGCGDNDCAYHILTAPAGEVSVIFGDSGGPVGTVRPDDRIDARGVISGGAVFVTCPAADTRAFNPQGDCYRLTSFYPIGRLVSHWGVNLETMS